MYCSRSDKKLFKLYYKTLVLIITQYLNNTLKFCVDTINIAKVQSPP